MAYRGSSSRFDVILFIIVLAVVILSQCRGALVSEDVAVRSLETNGFTDVEITNHAYMFVPLRGCGESDAARFDAEATNSQGERVKIYVCSGWLLKGATPRTW